MSDRSIDTPHDPPVSELYRRHATGEPSEAVDRRILALAHAAVSRKCPGAPPNRWWQRWRTPLALATTAALTLTLSIVHERQTGDPAAKAPVQAPAARASAPSLAVPADETERSPGKSRASIAEPGPAATGPAARVDLRAGSPAAADVPAPARSATGSSGEGAQEHAGGVPAGQAAQGPAERDSGASTKASPAAVAGGTNSGKAAPRALGVARESGRAEAALVPAPAAPAAVHTEKKAERSPTAWLEEIRRLRREGQTEEADRQLGEFRRVHPDFPVPEDLSR